MFGAIVNRRSLNSSSSRIFFVREGKAHIKKEDTGDNLDGTRLGVELFQYVDSF